VNYRRIYNRLIFRALAREDCAEYLENHHIIPRSEGGSNKKSNKVAMTIKEHHLAHLCLIRIGRCLKYCFRHLTSRQYIKMKLEEKVKKHLI
jgi:hypothetical protein